jgi:hypothetical protein
MTRRPAALLSCFALGLLCFVPACDGGGGGEASSEGDTDTVPAQPCGTEWVTKDASAPSTMTEFGAPCSSTADCVAILGEDGVCVTNILGVYDLPGGFCSRNCDLANTSVSFEYDAPQCSSEGGVTCVGAQGLFTACIIECTSDDNCGREGYGCRNMPTLAAEGDPKFCLMNPADCCTTDSGECGA